MTRPPPGPLPGDGGPFAEPAYRQPEYPHGYSARPIPEPPVSMPPRPMPTYPPRQPPLPPRERPRRATPVLAPVLALLGLALVGAASWWGFSFLDATLAGSGAARSVAAPSDDPILVAAASQQPDGTPSQQPEGTAEAAATPELVDPTNPPMVVNAPPGESAEVRGSIVFTRGGDIWSASGAGPQLLRLSDSDSTRSDSSPVWSPDGQHIYFIRTSKRETENSLPGGKYTLYPTDLMRMRADGSDKRTVYDSLIQAPAGLWFSHVLQPSASADDRTVAVVSDGPDGVGAVELHVVSTRTGRMAKVPVPGDGDLGHNDPSFSPDGKRLAYTYNSGVGTEGLPRIGVFTCRSRNNCTQGKHKLLKPGFANPSWSPDSQWLAVESTAGEGRDIALVSVRQGDVIIALTQGGDSFAPVVSPNGDQVAYLRRDGTSIDVRVATLTFDERGKPTLVDDQAVTSDGGIDSGSRPSWFIPADQLDRPAAGSGEGAEEGVEGEAATEPVASAEPGASPDGDSSSEGAPAPPGL